MQLLSSQMLCADSLSSEREEFKANPTLELKGVFVARWCKQRWEGLQTFGVPKETQTTARKGRAWILLPACLAGSPVPDLVQALTSDLCHWTGT